MHWDRIQLERTIRPSSKSSKGKLTFPEKLAIIQVNGYTCCSAAFSKGFPSLSFVF